MAPDRADLHAAHALPDLLTFEYRILGHEELTIGI